MKHAVVLLSGGIDSSTTLAIAIAQGYEVYSLSFDYGQRHNLELEAARRVAKSLGVKVHQILKIDMHLFGGSALTASADQRSPPMSMSRRGVRKQKSAREFRSLTYRHGTQFFWRTPSPGRK